jgi:preprotein translocase subunit SecE
LAVLKFDIYKRGQGKYTRLCSAFGLGLMAALGCLKLYHLLRAAELGLWIETMLPAAIFVVLAVLIFLMVNKAAVANFMIAAEGELKKVSWSSRREIVVSTVVVISVVILMAILLGITDLGFQLFFSWLLS